MQFCLFRFGRWTRLARLAAAAALVLFASSAYSASKTLLVLGDSLSAEYGLARDTGWVPLLQQRLKAQKADVAVVNASISGDTTSGGRARLPELLQQYHPAIVIIELGGNDGLRGLSVAASEANLRAMIEAAQKAGAKVVLTGMQLPPNYGREFTSHFAAMYGKLATETHAVLVPFLLEGVADRIELFQADRIHPTAEAQPIILDNVWPRLKPLLKN